MNQALALLEFDSVAAGVLAVDRMLKQAPIALLRCGSVHPGRYLALVGGSVASTEEAHAAGIRSAGDLNALTDQILLPDPHPLLAAAVTGERAAPQGEAVGVVEVSTSPGLLRAVDAVLKAVPVDLVEIRLADDLGGRALAVIDGRLPDVQEALERFGGHLGENTVLCGSSLLPRLDETLRGVLAEGTLFNACATRVPVGAEILEG
ncbi:MAG: BMC domain-containing protein [Candidatus Krumholzibacteriota bacterium]